VAGDHFVYRHEGSSVFKSVDKEFSKENQSVRKRFEGVEKPRENPLSLVERPDELLILRLSQ